MEPKLLTETEDFRTYEPQTVDGPRGTWVTIQLCEELVAGRWEPFYAIVKTEKKDEASRG